jgi:small subunit ribosomal protein S17
MDIQDLNEKLQEAAIKERILPKGQSLTGVVVSNKAKKTVTVMRDVFIKLPKYKRYMRKRSKIHAHVPGDILLELGDVVEISQSRKISKTKAWIVTKILKRGS